MAAPSVNMSHQMPATRDASCPDGSSTPSPQAPSARISGPRGSHRTRRASLGSGEELTVLVPLVEGLGREVRQRHQRARRVHARVLRIERGAGHEDVRSEEHTSELQSLMRIAYAVFCLKK